MEGAGERRRSYFRPGAGWSDDPAGATLRLDAQTSAKVEVETLTRLFRLAPDGSADPVPDEEDLSALERGLSFDAWQSAAAGADYVAFRGRRALDGDLLELLEGLTAYDEEGRRCDGVPPLTFLLSKADGREFARRVMQEYGGKVQMSEPTPASAQRSLERLRKIVSSVEELRAADRETLTQAQAGQLFGVPAFEARTKTLLELTRDLAETHARCRRALAPQLRQDKTENERALAQSLLAEASRIAEQVRVLREERDRDASELALLAAEARGERPLRQPVSPLLPAAREIARSAELSGIEVVAEGQLVKVRVPGGWLELAPETCFRPDGS